MIDRYDFGLDALAMRPSPSSGTTIVGAGAPDPNVVPTWMKVVGALAAMTLVFATAHYVLES